MATDTGIIYRKSTEEDLQSIAEFRKTNFAYNPSVRSCEADYYYWKCYQNPVQKGEIWLAETNNEIVAMKSVIPKEMLIRGEVVKVAEMGDSFTRPDYQRRGIFTELSKISRQSIIDKGIRLIYNTPTKATSLPGYLNKLDHVRIPVTLQSMVKPISSSINIAFSIPGNSIMRLFIPPAIALSRFRFNIATKR